ncbi:MAG: hypothetical protein ACRELY_19520 [Polyangiaceae bacterium]
MNRRAVAMCMICLFFGGIVSFGASACTDSPTHPFLGQEYDPVRDCLDSVTAVDTISGDDTGESCALVCVATPPDPEAGVSVYVSTTCPPYPPLFDTSGTSAQCQLALAAANRKATCLDDGGVSSTTPPDDAGDETDASSD